MRTRFSPRILIALVLALGGALSYFGATSMNEVTGEKQHVAISTDQERAIGLQAAPEMAEQYGGLLQDEGIQRYVGEVGNRVVAQSAAAKGPYEYQFHVLADPETVNAFALPGGQVFITVGLLRRLSNEAQLAGVLGHEVGHVVGRHGAEHLAKQQFSQALVGAAAVGAYDPNDPYQSQRTAAMAAAAANVVQMKFGRNDELEADALGVRFMAEAKYDADGMMQLMKVLESAGGKSRTPEFFSTHPDPGNRIERLEKLAAQSGQKGGETNEERFQQAVLARLGRPRS